MVNAFPDLPILGEPLIAEFANTLYIAGNERVDVLEHPRSVAAWLRQASCVVGLAAPRRIRNAEAEQLRRVRDAIRRLLLSTRGLTCIADVAVINDAADAAPSRRALAWRRNGSLDVVTESAASPFETLLSAIATAVIDAVQHGTLALYKICSRPECHMFYYQDHHRRRYCNERCANADRQARYNRRLHPNTSRNHGVRGQDDRTGAVVQRPVGVLAQSLGQVRP